MGGFIVKPMPFLSDVVEKEAVDDEKEEEEEEIDAVSSKFLFVQT